jgi:hypothetical protein
MPLFSLHNTLATFFKIFIGEISPKRNFNNSKMKQFWEFLVISSKGKRKRVKIARFVYLIF